MDKRRCCIKKTGTNITAVKIDLSFDTFDYQKWDASQKAKPGDWLVNNNNDIYTVDNDYFIHNYKYVSPGVYEKVGEVWVEIAQEDGVIKTLEGETSYIAGDYLVYDREEGGTGYAVTKQKFETTHGLKDEKEQLTDEQISYVNTIIKSTVKKFDQKATFNKRMFFLLQSIAALTAVSIPIVNNINSNDVELFKHIVSLLGGITALITCFMGLYKFQGIWLMYRGLYEELDLNVSQYTAKVGQYANVKDSYNLLVTNYQKIMQNERNLFKDKHGKEFKVD